MGNIICSDSNGWSYRFPKGYLLKKSRSNFPSLRKIKKRTQSYGRMRYPVVVPNTDLDFDEIEEWIIDIIKTGETVRANIQDHNPKYRKRSGDVIVTYYNGYKPVLVTGPKWAIKLDFRNRTLRLNGNFENDPTYILWNLR